MSTPINHHYVSQCQLRAFFNNEEGKIYLFDKKLNNIFCKTTTKSVFSEHSLNSAVVAGEVNHNVVEDDLRFYLEDSYSRNLSVIENYITTVSEAEDDFVDALMKMIRLGVIGEMRHPIHKKNVDDHIFGEFEMLASHAADNLKQQLEELLKQRKKTKYSNAIRYAQLSGEILKGMGEINFTTIYISSEHDYFILSDCSSVISRAKINEYFNPDIKEIGMVFMPISSKIAIVAVANNMDSQPGSIKYYTEKDRAALEMLNHTTLATSKRMIACENGDYLHAFVSRQKRFYNQAGLDLATSYDM
jgi:hypothetical protein